MGTTAQGLRYPEPTDPATDGATAIRNLAEDVDAGLAVALAPSGLLAVTSRFTHSQLGPASTEATAAAVTFTVPPSGSVLVRQSGLLNSANTSNVGVLFQLGTTVADESAGGDLVVGEARGSAVNVVYKLTGLTPGATVTYRSYLALSTTPTVFINWYGNVEVWAAP